MKKINLVYFGSPDFAANFLEKLLTDSEINKLIEVKLVVTQPDAPVGRKQILTPTPVRQMTEKYKISNIMSFPRRRESSLNIHFKNIDLALVYAYGDLIPKEMLNLPKYGFWNIHPSLLPKYRGTAPIATPLINGDKITGVTIIKMDEEIDHGPIIAQENYTIKETDYRTDLERNLTDLAFKMLKSIILSFPRMRESMTSGSLTLTTQQHELATYTKKLSKQDGFIEISKLKDQISKNSKELFNLFRGLYPWPGLWTMIKPVQVVHLDEAKRLKIIDIEFINGKLKIKKVQLEGKNEVDFETFNKAYKVF